VNDDCAGMGMSNWLPC